MGYLIIRAAILKQDTHLLLKKPIALHYCINVSNSLQHAYGGYSRRGNFGGSLVHSMYLMYSPDGVNVYGSRCGRLMG